MMRRLLRIVLALAIAGASAIGALLGLVSIERRRDVVLPAPTGPFAVGRVNDEWRDDHHADPFDPRVTRELVVWIWYPSTPSATAPRAEYLPPNWRDVLTRGRAGLLRLLTRDPALVHPHSILNATLSPAHAAYPVVVLRGGLGALTTDYTTLAENLASHGYVVVGFDAPHRTSIVVFGDGRVVTRAPADNPETLTGEAQGRLFAKLLAAWTADVEFVVDRLEQLNGSAASAFRGRLDLHALGVAGHSLGGATALQFCHDDPRCRAGIDIDGRPLGNVVREGLRGPFMFLLSDHGRERDPVSRQIMADISSIYDRLPPDSRELVTMAGANHFSFSDQMVVRSHVLMWMMQATGVLRLEPRRGLTMAAEHIRRFFDTYLTNARSAS